MADGFPKPAFRLLQWIAPVGTIKRIRDNTEGKEVASLDALMLQDICIRLLMACVFSGMIGWERESHNRPAGLRTHILVCVGAAVMALIQTEIMLVALDYGTRYPELEGVIRSDPARLICQVVSGIGFLGAGTIVVTQSSIRGLTTAASLWATGGLGLAIGMGYYTVAIAGFVVIFIVLTLVKRLHSLPTMKKIEIEYHETPGTRNVIINYFAERGIKVKDTEFSIRQSGSQKIYTNHYTIELPKKLTYSEIAEDLAQHENITEIRLMSV